MHRVLFLSENSGMYTDEELLRKNQKEGNVKVNSVDIEKESLMRDTCFKALLAQAKREPGLDKQRDCI